MLNDELGFVMPQGRRPVTYHKYQFLKFLRNQGELNLTCDISVTPEQEWQDLFVAKLDMRFIGYTRSDFITIVNDDGWKITHVYIVFAKNN